MIKSHLRPRVLAGSAALALALAVVPTIADAHVRVNANSTAAGSFSALSFRVPNESDDASTVAVQVELPSDKPFVYVSVKPVPGWKAVAQEAPLPTPVESGGATITKAVRTVTWTAEAGGGVRPGEYQEFSISAGPLPEAGEVLLPTKQTYSDGTVVDWNQQTPTSGAEPEHPAPVLVVTAATEGGHEHTDQDQPAPVAATASAADPMARGLAAGGLALGALAVVVSLISRRRNSPTGTNG